MVDATLYHTRIWKQKPSNRQLRQLRGAEMAERCSTALINPARAWLWSHHRLCLARCWLAASQIGCNLDSWDSGSLSPHSLVWCYCWLFLSNYYCYWVIIDLDWTCINKNWLNSTVTCVDSLSFFGASVACRAVGSICGPAPPVPDKAWKLAYRKDYSVDTCIVRESFMT